MIIINESICCDTRSLTICSKDNITNIIFFNTSGKFKLIYFDTYGN